MKTKMNIKTVTKEEYQALLEQDNIPVLVSLFSSDQDVSMEANKPNVSIMNLGNVYFRSMPVGDGPHYVMTEKNTIHNVVAVTAENKEDIINSEAMYVCLTKINTIFSGMKIAIVLQNVSNIYDDFLISILETRLSKIPEITLIR